MINAIACALMDAAIDMKCMMTAVGVAIVPISSDDTMDHEDASQNYFTILDPSAEEERDAICTLCVAFSFGQGHSGTEGSVCFLEMGSGNCEEQELLDAIDLAKRAAHSTLAFIRKSQEAKYS